MGTTSHGKGEPLTMIKLKENPIAGQVVNMGSDMIVPALNFHQIQILAVDIKKMDTEKDDSKRIEAQAKVIHQAFKRNYPEATIEEVKELLDMTNILPAMAATMGQKYQVADDSGK